MIEIISNARICHGNLRGQVKERRWYVLNGGADDLNSSGCTEFKPPTDDLVDMVVTEPVPDAH